MDKYLISIDDEFGDDLGINLISFVKNPAIKTKGFAFNKQEKGIKFSNNEAKMRIVAPAMIPMDIYRYSEEEDYEYEVRFTPEVIEKIRGKFMANLQNNDIFNLEHTDEMTPAYILETWIVGEDPIADKSFSEYGIEVPSGTMMVMSQITERNYYNKLVEEEQFAYSVEGFFGLDELKLMINKKQETKMEDLKLPDGEHTIGDKVYVVKDGSVIEVKDVEIEAKEEEVQAEEEIKAEEEIVEEEKLEEDQEEVQAEEDEEKIEAEVEDEKVEEEKLEINEDELMAIIQPKLDEIYKMIADLSADTEEEPAEEVMEEEVKMRVNERFSHVTNFLKKK
jgi:hypothetical protein